MAIISGTLTDGTGQIINNCTIVLHAKRTTATVLNQTQAFNVASNGAYNMTVSPCDYDVLLLIDGFPPKKLGQIQVFSTSKNGTLNDFLLLPQTGQPITPAVLEQITDERVKAQAAATAAKASENNAANTLAGAVKKSGDTMTGQLILDYSSSGIKLKYENDSLMVVRTSGDNFSVMYNDVAVNSWSVKLRYSATPNVWRFENIEDVTINGKSALKQGDAYPNTGLLNNTDLNTLTGSKFGFYCQNLNAKALASLNYPAQFAGNLVVYQNYTGGIEGCTQRYNTFLYNKEFIRSYYPSSGWTSWVEELTTANSTVDSNGFYKKASPILRLYATDELDNVEGYTKAGYGLVNSEAHGVTAKRISVGHYEVYGSLGFAKEGWYITLPEDANGNKKIFAEYSADENNVITIKTYTKKFDFEKCEVVAGEPIDITDTRWIDVRLEMPVIEVIEQEEPIPSTLNPIVSEVSE